MPATLFVVATPIGNLEDITTRALRVLREAALIAAEDTRRTAQLLARYGIQTPTTSLHAHNEHRKTASILARLQHGDSVALVSDAGTPAISDPGQRLIQAAIHDGIRVEPIPGANAAIAALAVSGFDANRFTFLGFPPNRGKDRKLWLEGLRHVTGTVVFYEAPHRIRQTLADIQAVAGDQEAVLGRELTKAHEELVRGPISEVLGRILAPKGEFTVVLDLRQIPEKVAGGEPSPTSDSSLLEELGDTTKITGLTRRKAIALIASRHQKSPNEIYAAIERARKSGK
jgi:16S rRNA (cytidine1402-2'-O)-methyltransferase